MLPFDQAGARHSQSPIVANGGAVIEPAYSLGAIRAGQRTLPGQDNWEGPAAIGSENEGGS
jgi:hypothetical protein